MTYKYYYFRQTFLIIDSLPESITTIILLRPQLLFVQIEQTHQTK